MTDRDDALFEMGIEKIEELRRERDAWKEQAGLWEAEAKALQARLMDLEASHDRYPAASGATAYRNVREPRRDAVSR